MMGYLCPTIVSGLLKILWVLKNLINFFETTNWGGVGYREKVQMSYWEFIFLSVFYILLSYMTFLITMLCSRWFFLGNFVKNGIKFCFVFECFCSRLSRMDLSLINPLKYAINPPSPSFLPSRIRQKYFTKKNFLVILRKTLS